MRVKSLLGLALILGLVSCEEEAGTPGALDGENGIVGIWVEDTILGDVKTLHRAGDLDPDQYGFRIAGDGSYVERKNAGWCGTPPITYGNFNGTWTALSDSLLGITVGYWGGIMSYQLRILEVNESQLRIRYLYADDLAESR